MLAIPPRVTDRAFDRLREIGAAPKALRVAVEGGGCSGFQYEIKLDDPAEDDLVLEKDGERVLIDPVSLPPVHPIQRKRLRVRAHDSLPSLCHLALSR